MALTVQQTLPFSPSSLDLHNSSRWNTLLPLIRPSVHTTRTPKGQNILVDSRPNTKKFIPIAVVGSLGQFSSTLLDDLHVSTIVTEQAGAGLLTSEDIAHAMQTAGGVVIVRVGMERNVRVQGHEMVEVTAKGLVEADHVVKLLGKATESARTSFHQVAEMLRLWVKGLQGVEAKFGEQKMEGRPVVGGAGFGMAREAVQRNLKALVDGLQTDGMTVSVHYADINGLSRLENYIIAGEIGKYLESQNILFVLSHSTVLNHDDATWGYHTSICPLPSHYLTPQSKSTPHKPSPANPTTTTSPTAQSSSQTPTLNLTDFPLRTSITAGCNALIASEPTITHYDTIVGDGDCGTTLRSGAEQVLTFISSVPDLSTDPHFLSRLITELEVNMGGTSGALYCIFLTALSSHLDKSVPEALREALETLMQFTRARKGDRTMMDALIPFVEVLGQGKAVEEAVREMREGVEGTKRMEATLGRSAYLDEKATAGVPDPGAYGLMVLLEGMAGLEGQK